MRHGYKLESKYFNSVEASQRASQNQSVYYEGEHTGNSQDTALTLVALASCNSNTPTIQVCLAPYWVL